jgi:hypothetical protein
VERLRKIAKQIAGANEKVVFGLMVLVLIWQVVQIFRPGMFPGLTLETKARRPDPVPPSKEPPPLPKTLPNVQLDVYKDIDVAKWNVPGQGTVVPEETPRENEPGLPDIKFKGIEKIGGTAVYAKISVDGGSAQRVRQGQRFAKGQAMLETIDVEANKIVFKWLPSGTKYERQATT